MSLPPNKYPGDILSNYYYTLSDIATVGMCISMVNGHQMNHEIMIQSIDDAFRAYDLLEREKYIRARGSLRSSLELAQIYREELSCLLKDKSKEGFLYRTFSSLSNLLQLLEMKPDRSWADFNQKGISSLTDLSLVRFDGSK